MRETDIVIIGGGAAGLMAACAAARVLGTAGGVLVVEGNEKLGRKLLATGNGRCNLTNLHVSPAHYHGDAEAVAPLFETYTPEFVRGVFREMGLVTRADDAGRVYPSSMQSAAVLAALRRAAEENGASCITGSGAISVLKAKGGFLVKCANGEEIRAKKCVLACGGAASPRHSSEKDSYLFARALGHTTTQLYPALTQLLAAGKTCKYVSGMRVPADAALLADGAEIYRESGEVQFTDTGLSGICIFGLSLYAGEFFASGGIGGKRYKTLAVSLDCMPTWSFAALCAYLSEMRAAYPNMMAGDLLSGMLNLRVGFAIVKSTGVDTALAAKLLSADALARIAAAVKAWRFEITGTKGFADAQITAGGVPLGEVSLPSMASKKAPGLYLAGEMLNVHGDCGGYNLHFAWVTGLCAGEHAARAVKEGTR